MQNVVLGFHGAMVPLILTAAGLTLICGIALLFVTRGGASNATLDRVFRIMLIVVAGLGVLQVLFGALLYLQGERPAEGLHFVYGVIVLGAIPVAYVYSDQKNVRRDIIIMCIAVVAVIGAAVRALMTG